mmetsp:Transcript_6715/g.28606  ORF Transcript_6715/g.28606 Transcript_6715/m.28606 type:complete len:221 (+) Transcript_6715:181-843(+)
MRSMDATRFMESVRPIFCAATRVSSGVFNGSPEPDPSSTNQSSSPSASFSSSSSPRCSSPRCSSCSRMAGGEWKWWVISRWWWWPFTASSGREYFGARVDCAPTSPEPLPSPPCAAPSLPSPLLPPPASARDPSLPCCALSPHCAATAAAALALAAPPGSSKSRGTSDRACACVCTPPPPVGAPASPPGMARCAATVAASAASWWSRFAAPGESCSAACM